MSEKMKSVIIYGTENYKTELVDRPECGPGEVRIKNAFAAFCGNDLRIINGRHINPPKFPATISHEYSGIIDQVGEGVTDYKIGDKVCYVPKNFCGKCYYCSKGMHNLCQNVVKKNIGGFCEYTVMDAEHVRRGSLVKLPQDMPLDVAGLIEPMACAMNGVRRAGVKLGDTVLIIGAGTMGMLNMELSLLAGASKVIVSDLNPQRRERALSWGATRAVDPTQEDLLKVIEEETDGQGVDVSILAIGIPAMVNDMFKMTKKGGTTYLFAGFAGDTTTTIDVNLIHYREVWVSGNSGPTMTDYYISRDLVATGKFDLGKYITHRFDIEDFDAAYKKACDGSGLKVGIEFYKG